MLYDIISLPYTSLPLQASFDGLFDDLVHLPLNLNRSLVSSRLSLFFGAMPCHAIPCRLQTHPILIGLNLSCHVIQPPLPPLSGGLRDMHIISIQVYPPPTHTHTHVAHVCTPRPSLRATSLAGVDNLSARAPRPPSRNLRRPHPHAGLPVRRPKFRVASPGAAEESRHRLARSTIGRARRRQRVAGEAAGVQRI